MRKVLRGLAILLVLFAIVVYARGCRMSFNQWKYCGATPSEARILGDWVHFDWRPSGLFSDILYVDGKPSARLARYHFRLVDDVIEVVSLDGTQTSHYCGK